MEQITHILGVDVGVTGGLCLLRVDNPGSCFPIRFPLIEERKPNKRKNRSGEGSKNPYRIERTYDLPKLVSILDFSPSFRAGLVAMVEQVAAMPVDGSTQAFKFGSCLGQVQGVLAALGIRAEFVRPGDWIRVMVPGRKDKKDHIRAAEKLIAEWDVPGWQETKLSDGEADAILLAEYGRRRLRARG